MRTFQLLVIALFVSGFAHAQLKEQAAIDSIFSKWNKPGVPGCAIGIIKDGKLLYAKGYGMANLDYDIPNTPNSVFRIGSTSKQFTAACIMRLVQQGKLSLDNTLDKFYPAFPPYAKKITIRHLLHHTSGIRDYLVLSYLKGYRDDDFYTDEELMSWLVNQAALNFSPGDEHLYSNSGYWLLGQIVNKAAGMTMAEYAEQELFKPLGMANTHFHTNHNQVVKNRATGYTPVDDKEGYEICMTTLDQVGDGGIFTTINDIKKWDDAFYRSDVLNKQFWDMMTQRGVLNNGDTIDYACGLIIDNYKGLKTISHGGAFVGYRAEILRFPEQHFTVAVFANRADANPTGMAYKVANVFLKDKYTEAKKAATEKKDTATTSADETPKFALAQLTGKYTIQPGIEMDIVIKNDSLNITQSWNNVSYNVTETGRNIYGIPGTAELTFTFTALADGMAQEVIIVQNGHKTTCKRKKAVDLSGIDLEDYTGNYFCPELDAGYVISLKDSSLYVQVRSNDPMSLEIIEKDQYAYPGCTLRFQRKNGAVTGFELDAGRVKNLAFVKK